MSTIKELLNLEREKFLNQDAIILVGKYKGRKAKITEITILFGKFFYLVQPYRLIGNGDELLWNDAQARSYRKSSEFELIG